MHTMVRDLRAKPLRTVLTCISMLVGVLGIVGVAAADQLSTGYVIAAHEQLRGREVTYAVGVPFDPHDRQRTQELLKGVHARIGPQDGDAALSVTHDISARRESSPEVMLSAEWFAGDVDTIYRRPVVTGRQWSAERIVAPPVTVNESAARHLGISSVPTTISLTTPMVTGTVLVTGVRSDADGDPVLYGPLDDVSARWPELVEDAAASLLIRMDGHSLGLATTIVQDAAYYADVQLGDEPRRVDTVDEARASAQVVERSFAAVGVVALVVAGLGILNIGLASLSERARELVVRRAVGARRLDVFVQVLGTNIIMAVIVAAVTCLLVVIGVYAVAPTLTDHEFIADPVAMPWHAMATGVVAAIATSALGSIAPAIKATRLPVADALRT